MNIMRTLPTSEQVRDQLLEQYGPNKLWQIRRLGERLFQVWTTDGKVLMVSVLNTGRLSIRETEAMY